MPDAYFTAAELRDRYPDDLTDPPFNDAKLEEFRDLAEQAFEDACGRAFVPRETSELLGWRSPCGGHRLRRTDITHIVSAVDATNGAVDVSQLRIRSGWIEGIQHDAGVTVTYGYGLAEPPLRVKHAVMSLARQWMLNGPVDDRHTQIATEGGGSINLATPGLFGSMFGLPEVDACVKLYGVRPTRLG